MQSHMRNEFVSIDAENTEVMNDFFKKRNVWFHYLTTNPLSTVLSFINFSIKLNRNECSVYVPISHFLFYILEITFVSQGLIVIE